MAKISVEIEAMIEEAKLISDCTEDINNIIIKLTNGLNKLSESWKDSEFEKFTEINRDKVTQLEQTKNKFDNIFKILNSKINVANKYLAIYNLSSDNSGLTNINNSSNVKTHTKEINKPDNINQNSNSGESIVTGEKMYKPFGTYVGKLKGSEKKCHDKEGKLIFRNKNVFIGEFKEDIPISGELSFHENKYLEKYIGDVKIEDEKFVSDGEGTIIFHKDKFKLGEFIDNEKSKMTVFGKSKNLNDYVVNYEGELTDEYLIHGQGIIVISRYVEDETNKFFSIRINSMEGKIIKMGGAIPLMESKIEESKIEDFIETKINEWLPSAALEVGIVAKPILATIRGETIKLEELLRIIADNNFDILVEHVCETFGKTLGKLGGVAGTTIGGAVAGPLGVIAGPILVELSKKLVELIPGISIDEAFKIYFKKMDSPEKRIEYLKRLFYKYENMRNDGIVSGKKNSKYFIKDDYWNKIIGDQS